ncbi:MAG: hypothetical protein ACYDD4_13845 [Acidimicrobiales bacterium]
MTLLDGSAGCVSGELVGIARHKVATRPEGRLCEERGCRTRLSVYNSHARCALHDFDTSLAHFHVVAPPPGTQPTFHQN